MDKEWTKLLRSSVEYIEGLDKFLDFAFNNVLTASRKILCPCKWCINLLYQVRSIVRDHLIRGGFLRTYKVWTDHGETLSSNTPDSSNENENNNIENGGMPDMLNDIFVSRKDDPNFEAQKFDDYLSDVNEELYPGCKTDTKLSFIVWLFNLKCTSKWTDKSFDLLIGKLKEVLPGGEKLPTNFYEIKKMIGDLGFSYAKIDAWPNDCMLYWRKNCNFNKCLICKASRWKTVRCESQSNEDEINNTMERKVVVKQLRHYPLIPRLKRLFMSSKTVESMRWHQEKHHKDGVLRHPDDSKAWKHFDSLNPSFSSDSLNVRLGLSIDGMDPYSHGANHSIWPVIIVVYNLPPWMYISNIISLCHY